MLNQPRLLVGEALDVLQESDKKRIQTRMGEEKKDRNFTGGKVGPVVHPGMARSAAAGLIDAGS